MAAGKLYSRWLFHDFSCNLKHSARNLTFSYLKFALIEYVKTVGEKVGEKVSSLFETKEPSDADIAAEKVVEEKKFVHEVEVAQEALKQDQKEFGKFV